LPTIPVKRTRTEWKNERPCFNLTGITPTKARGTTFSVSKYSKCYRTVRGRRLFLFLRTAVDELPSSPPVPSPLPFSHPLPSPPLPLEVGIGPLNTARGSGRALHAPPAGSGRSPSRRRQTIYCILESKNAALVAAVFVDFPKN